MDKTMTIKEIEELIEFYASNECLAEHNRIRDIELGRFTKFEKYVETIDFDRLIYRLILEHNEEYREKYWHNGEEPLPNNKLSFLFNFLDVKHSTLKEVPKELDSKYSNQVWEYKGFYFQMVWGEELSYHIYNKKDLQPLLLI